MACRICTLLNGKSAKHEPDRLHSNAPAVPIASVVTAGLECIRAAKAARA